MEALSNALRNVPIIVYQSLVIKEVKAIIHFSPKFFMHIKITFLYLIIFIQVK